MKRNIELTLEMQLGKLQNLKENIKNIESKISKLEEELNKYKNSILETENAISQLGLSVIPEKDRNSISFEKRHQFEEKNKALQDEKRSYIETNFPELAKKEDDEEDEFLRILNATWTAVPTK